MVYRYSWLAGFAVLAFALFELNTLLRPTLDGPPWQFVVLAGLVLGVVITWTALTYRLRTLLVVLANAGAAFIALVRIAAPETTFLFLPTSSSFTELHLQWDQAMTIVRNGHEPVLPVSGLVVLLMVLIWALGAVMVWGLMRGHPYVALVPPLVLSLQLTTMHRGNAGLVTVGIFLILVAGAILALTADERDRAAGRMVRRGAWASRSALLAPSAALVLGLTVLTGVAAAGALDRTVPYDGALQWRATTGLTGGFFGGIRYNPFISIQQGLVNQSPVPVFTATIEGDLAGDQIFFRLLTMETYNGGQFFANEPDVFSLDERPWEFEDVAFAGPMDSVRTNIEILALEMDWLPAAYAPQNVIAESGLRRSIDVRRADGSLVLGGVPSFRGMRYDVESLIPRPDIAALSGAGSTTLSPVFDAASEDNAVPSPRVVPLREVPPNVDQVLALPEDLDTGVTALAFEATRNLATPFEKAIALEAFFRDSDLFTYDANVLPGHGATDLADWLLDPESNNWRTGYCEQFATSMAIMARTLDIPSRVVLGFTPGRLIDRNQVVVLDSNAHAWVELWMPSQGWVRFDPTPRGDGVNPTTFSAISRELGFDIRQFLEIPDPEPIDVSPGGVVQRPFEEGPDLDGFLGGGGSASETPFRLPGWLSIAIPAGILLAVFLGGIPAVKWWRRRRRMRRLREGDITAAWDEIVARLTDLGRAPKPTLTPAEVAREVDPAMTALATVYARAVYGPDGSIGGPHLDAATKSLAATEARLTTRYSPGQRLLARYRLKTVTPRWLRRRRNR